MAKTYGYYLLREFTSKDEYETYYFMLDRTEVAKVKKFFKVLGKRWVFEDQKVDEKEIDEKCAISPAHHKIKGKIRHQEIKTLLQELEEKPHLLSLVRKEFNGQIIRLFRTRRWVVIGGGPAGLTAAINLARAGKEVIVLADLIGGEIVSSVYIDNYPGFKGNPSSLIANMKAQAVEYGVTFISARVDKIAPDEDILNKKYKVFFGDAYVIADGVIVATGSRPRFAGIEGEERLLGRGVSTCVACDGPFFADKKVLVVGNGDTAFTYLIQLKEEFKAKPILIAREDKPMAQEYLVEKAKELNLSVYYNSYIDHIIGRNEVAQALVIVDGEERIMQTKAIFLAVGHDKNTALFENMNLEEKPEWLEGDHLYAVGDCYKGGSVVACCAYAFNLVQQILRGI